MDNYFQKNEQKKSNKICIHLHRQADLLPNNIQYFDFHLLTFCNNFFDIIDTTFFSQLEN